MNRRTFLTTTASAAAMSAASEGAFGSGEEAAAGKGREYYELRRYHVQSGRQQKITDAFLREALVPRLNRLEISSVGVFTVDIGPVNPCYYVLIPAPSAEALVTIESRLGLDAEYLKAGAPFLDAPADQPAFIRMESSLMVAFEGRPRLQVPTATTERKPRVFELRTYESPSNRDHRRKVEMFNSGEYDVFEKAGFWQIFYGDVLIGPRLPCLTYMIGFNDLAERNAKWKAFGSASEWKKLTSSQRFSFESIVSNVTNLILSPTSYSQI